MIGISVTVTTRRVDIARLRIGRNVAAANLETAREVKQEAQKRCPKKTGATSESIMVIGQGVDEYEECTARAKALNPDVQLFDRESLPVVEEGDNSAYTVVGAKNGIFLETGTYKMGAQPFMGPSLEAVRQKHADRLGKAVTDAFSGL